MLEFAKRYLGTRTSAGARRVAILYAAVAGLWIFASDYLLSIWTGRDYDFELSQTIKGLGFVGATAALLFVATRRQLQRLQRESHLRQVAEATTVRTELLFKKLFEGNPLPTWVVDENTLQFLEVNESALKHYGYTREEFLSLRLSDLQAPEARAAAPDKLHTPPSADAVEVRHLTKSGQQLLVEVWVSHLEYDGRACLLSVVSDITARRKAEDELRASEEKFREIAETIQEVFWVIDPVQHRIVYISPAYERVWGRRCADLYESVNDWLESIHPDDRERVAEASRDQAARPFNVEYRIIRPDGTQRWIADHAVAVRNEAGECIRFIGVAEDITARKKSEAEHERLEAQFRQAQKMEAVGQLSAGISHDFNNLLTVVQMQTAIMLSEPGRSAEDTAALQEIERATLRAGDLTRQLLAFSRQQKMTPQNVDLNEIVTNVTKLLRRAVGQNIQLHVECADVALAVYADPGMIEQVLVNLAMNARDAMPRGGPLKVTTSLAEFDAEGALSTTGRTGRFACISVEDSGTGIASEHLPRIFEPFFTTKDVGKGTGLGLAMVYGIAQQHDGWIEVDTEPGNGTTFRVYLPLGSGENVSAPHVEHATFEGRGTILMLEDDENIRRVVASFLSTSGYRVIVASDGQDGLVKWQQRNREIDLLLTDLVLPGGVNGREFAGRILQDRPTLPVIYMSGYSSHLQDADTEFVEGENFLAKPFSPQRLGAIIQQRLENAYGSRAGRWLGRTN